MPGKSAYITAKNRQPALSDSIIVSQQWKIGLHKIKVLHKVIRPHYKMEKHAPVYHARNETVKNRRGQQRAKGVRSLI